MLASATELGTLISSSSDLPGLGIRIQIVVVPRGMGETPGILSLHRTRDDVGTRRSILKMLLFLPPLTGVTVCTRSPYSSRRMVSGEVRPYSEIESIIAFDLCQSLSRCVLAQDLCVRKCAGMKCWETRR